MLRSWWWLAVGLAVAVSTVSPLAGAEQGAESAPAARAFWPREPGTLDFRLRDAARRESVGMMIDGYEPASTLRDLARYADLAVVADVTSVTFPNLVRTDVRVRETLFGPRLLALTLYMNGGVEQFDGLNRIIQQDGAQVMLPGWRMVLFVKRDEIIRGSYRVVLATGQYRLVDGRVFSREGNPFQAEVDGLTLAEFKQRVSAARGPAAVR